MRRSEPARGFLRQPTQATNQTQMLECHRLCGVIRREFPDGSATLARTESLNPHVNPKSNPLASES